MANLRIVSDNIIKSATLSTSTTAGTLVANNMKTEVKSQVWRATTTSGTITATWTGAQQLGCVALPFCNLTSTSTIRVRGSFEGSQLLDTGVVMACAYAPFGMWEWGDQPLGVNAFSYGGGAYGRVWFNTVGVDTLIIDIMDTDNPAGYIEFSRLVAGTYWSPSLQPQNVELTTDDTGKQYRTDAGDLFTDVGTRNRKISMEIENMVDVDRSRLWKIFLKNGKTQSVFISFFPENDDDPELEQSYQIYGKISDMAAITAPYYKRYSAPIEIEEN